eukprot:1161075-Pelagomonas_calceolata.AAC.19
MGAKHEWPSPGRRQASKGWRWGSWSEGRWGGFQAAQAVSTCWNAPQWAVGRNSCKPVIAAQSCQRGAAGGGAVEKAPDLAAAGAGTDPAPSLHAISDPVPAAAAAPRLLPPQLVHAPSMRCSQPQPQPEAGVFMGETCWWGLCWWYRQPQPQPDTGVLMGISRANKGSDVRRLLIFQSRWSLQGP